MIENYSIDFFLFVIWHLINGTVSFPLINFWNSFFSYQLQAIFAKRRFSLKKSDSCKISLETTRWQKSGKKTSNVLLIKFKRGA